MRVEIITCWYNEQFLAPYFLKHHSWVDNITILYDVDTKDNTMEAIKKYSNITIKEVKYPDGMDDLIKVGFINKQYSDTKSDWVMILDCDEFVFLSREDLASIYNDCEVCRVDLYHVYRHVTDSDLTLNRPIRVQRKHGWLEPMYSKPVIVKGGLSLNWAAGNHHVDTKPEYRLKYPHFIGAHWANADLCFCLERRLKNRRDRQSQSNLINKLTLQNHNITEADIIKECKDHENDPKVF